MSQPALSTQIRELERRLGTTLVERMTTGAQLTPEGEEVAARARRIISEVNDLVTAARFDPDALHGTVHLGVIPTLAPYVLPRVVATLTSRHPGIELHLHELRTDELVQEIADGTVDIGLLALPAPIGGLVEAPLGDDPFLLAIPEGHPLAKSRGPIDDKELRNLRVLLLEEGHCLRDQAVAACRLARVEPADIQATSLPALVQMVAAGMGVTYLPASASAVEARPGNGVVTKRLKHPSHRTIGLAWRSTSPRSNHYAELAKLLKPALRFS